MKIDIKIAREIITKISTDIKLYSELLQFYSKDVIISHLMLNRLDSKILPLVIEDKIDIRNAYALAKLPIKEQNDFLNNAINMDPKDFVPKCFTLLKTLK